MSGSTAPTGSGPPSASKNRMGPASTTRNDVGPAFPLASRYVEPPAGIEPATHPYHSCCRAPLIRRPQVGGPSVSVADRGRPEASCSEWHGDGTAGEDDRGSVLMATVALRELEGCSLDLRRPVDTLAELVICLLVLSAADRELPTVCGPSPARSCRWVRGCSGSLGESIVEGTFLNHLRSRSTHQAAAGDDSSPAPWSQVAPEH
jgi:hypothetical protein